MSNNVNIVNVGVGALPASTTRALFKAPSAANGGGIRILEAEAVMSALGTAGLTLIDMGPGGTANVGTVATRGSVAFGAGTPQAFTVTRGSDFIAADRYLGIVSDASGNCALVTTITIKYLMGR